MIDLLKYPRTRHLQGSRLQAGDEDLDQVPLAGLSGARLVVEEKLDGANAGIRFTADGRMWLQSRGHYLVGGDFEQFDLFKSWAETHRWWLHEVLGHRYVVYGEWCHKKHTVFYDALPHLFMEFDVLDTETGAFLSTDLRRLMWDGVSMVSVPVLHDGLLTGRTKPGARTEPDARTELEAPTKLDARTEAGARAEAEARAALESLVRPSLYKSAGWQGTLERLGAERNLDLGRLWAQTDPSDLSEGLYIKHEEGDAVVGRYKWVRHDFHQRIVTQNEDARGHVAFTPFVPNQLAPGADIFASP